MFLGRTVNLSSFIYEDHSTLLPPPHTHCTLLQQKIKQARILIAKLDLQKTRIILKLQLTVKGFILKEASKTNIIKILFHTYNLSIQLK